MTLLFIRTQLCLSHVTLNMTSFQVIQFQIKYLSALIFCPKKLLKCYIKYYVSADTVSILFSHIQYNTKTFEYLIRNRK